MSAPRSNRPSSGGRPGSSRGGSQGGAGRGGAGGRDSGRGGGGRRDGGGRDSGRGGAGGRAGGGRDGGGSRGGGRGRDADGRSADRDRRDDRGGRGGPDGRTKRNDRRGPSSRGDKFSPKWRQDMDSWNEEPMTEARRRAAEVDQRRGPRPPADPDRDRRWADERVTEQWVDEGSVRDVARAATQRAATERPERREPRPLDPDIGAELVDALGGQRGARLSERLAQASEALDRERFDEARRLAAAIAKEAPTVSAVQEVLGLASYRLGRYKPAVAALQAAQELHENPALLPVIADAYRGLRRWAAVERVWGQIKAASPPHHVLAEGRIVMASALADQGDVAGAIAVMEDGRKTPKRVRDHHLREWYVIADLYDRLGDPIAARRWFSNIAAEVPDYFDVAERLRGLGR